MPINGTRHQVRGNGEEDCNHFMWLCKDMTKIDDATLRSVFSRHPVLGSGENVSRYTPGPCGTHFEKSLDYYLVLGTGDQMYKRILSAYHSNSDSILFVVQSDAEAWWRDNRTKSLRRRSDGNRVSFTKFHNILNATMNWENWAQNITILEIETPEASIEYNKFFH